MTARINHALAMPLRRLLLLVLLLPLLEIYVLIKVGDAIGGLATVLLVVVMAVLGLLTLRLQGVATAFRARAALARGELPGAALLQGLWFLLAGVLLLIPGFITDGIALLLFLAPVRRALGHLLVGSMVGSVRRGPHPPPTANGRRTIEGEFTRRDD